MSYLFEKLFKRSVDDNGCCSLEWDGPAIPVEVVSPEGTTKQVTSVLLCEPDTKKPVMALVCVDKETGDVTQSFRDITSGADYTGDTSALEVCSDEQIESDQIIMCDAGTEFIRWILKDNGEPTGVSFDTDVSGVTYTASGAEVIGKCVIELDRYDVETVAVCNTDTNFYDAITKVFINEVEDSETIVATTTPCDEDKPDFEQVRVCRAGFINIVTNQIDSDGTITEINVVVTPESCAEPVKQDVDVEDCDGVTSTVQVDSVVKVEGVIQAKLCPEDVVRVDVEYFCDSDSDLLQESVTTTTNGLPVTVITATTTRCEDLDLSKDFEESVICDTLTKTKHIVTTAYLQDDTSILIGDVDTQEPCDCPEWQWHTGCDKDTNTPVRWKEGLDFDGNVVYPNGGTTPVYYYKDPTDQLPVECNCIGLGGAGSAQTTIEATVLGNTISIDGDNYTGILSTFINALNSGQTGSISFTGADNSVITWTGAGTATTTTSGTATNVTIESSPPLINGCQDEIDAFIASNPTVEGSVSEPSQAFGAMTYVTRTYVCLVPEPSDYDYNSPITTQPTNVTCEPCPNIDPVYSLDYECNSETGNYDEIISELVNRLPTNQIVKDTGLPCGSTTIEVNESCRTDTNTLWKTIDIIDNEGNIVLSNSIDTGVECERGEQFCVESQEWTYGIDNTGTSFAEDNTIKLTLSDGSSFVFNQAPTTGWTPQMQIWGDEIQAAADANGLAWFVETRFRDPANPANLAGGGGFAGPPSVAVSNNLTNMLWRYVNIQICPGQPVPVSAEIIDSSNPVRIGYTLTSDGAVLGPIQKFWICKVCGEEPVWYLEDGVTLATAGQIPNCYEPCGTLALTSSPPDRDCSFEIDVACDNNNSTNTVDFTNTITRRATVCNGEQIAVDYFEADPNDSNALITYTLVGDFVDCATGEPIALPVPECNRFEITELYRITNKTQGLISNEWNSSPIITAGDIEEARALYQSLEGTASTLSGTFTNNVAQLADTNAVSGEATVQIREGYICVSEPILMRHTASSEGSIFALIGECGGDYETMYELSKSSVAAISTDSYLIPKGIHKIKLVNVDNGGINSVWQPQTSTNGGVTWSTDTDMLDDFVSYTAPSEECEKVKVCEDTGAFIGLIDGVVKDPSEYYGCSLSCSKSGGSSSGGEVDNSVMESILKSIDDKTCSENDETQTVQTGNGNVPAGAKSVTINNLTGITTLNGGFQLGTGRRVDSISFGTDRGNCINELLPAYTLSGGTWQWIAHF